MLLSTKLTVEPAFDMQVARGPSAVLGVLGVLGFFFPFSPCGIATVTVWPSVTALTGQRIFRVDVSASLAT